MLKLTLDMWQNLKNIYHFAQAFLSALYFDFPSKKLVVVGITGTDGKTTTVNMLHHILASSGKKVSSISSINAVIGHKRFDTGFHVTTPNPWQVQKYLKQAADSGSDYFILEATSHGLDQNRLAFVDFELAAITNISHEHLDYHKNKQNYLMSKAKLFKNVKYSILNADDQSFNDLKEQASGKVLTYSLSKKTDFNIKKFPIKLKIAGDFNLENALVALSVAITLGLNKHKVLRALSTFTGISGRLESIDLGQNFDVYVDFAHTPNALEQVLKTLRPLVNDKQSTRLIAVFGAAGKRDKSKRPLMGKIASKLADVSILTAEDPRTEDVNQICKQIALGFTSNSKQENKDFFIIPDRKEAIKFAIDLASEGDTVALFGKGHEKSMNVGNKEIPWSDASIARWAINRKIK